MMKSRAQGKIRQSVVNIRIIDAEIPANISVPEQARGLVVFGGGLGSGRYAPANRRVADVLNGNGFATVLADLLRGSESPFWRDSASPDAEIDILEERVVAVTDWIAMQAELSRLAIGYFGAGRGAEATLIAAAKRSDVVRAAVACGAKLDLVEYFLCEITAPTLLIVGSDDTALLSLHRSAHFPEQTVTELSVIDGPSDISQNEAAVDRIADLATGWFQRFLSKTGCRLTPAHSFDWRRI